MKLDRLRIQNFRNLPDVDIPLSPGTVVVGENRAGKSNLVHALRLVLDASLPNSERQLRAEDFWDGLADGSDEWDPMAQGAVIEITVEMSDFDDDPTLLAVLGDAFVSEDPVRARLTFRFAPRPTAADQPAGSAGYEWRIFGGEDEDLHIAGDLRGYLHLVYLHALRDVASDLASWRRSPLRLLLEAATAAASPEELQEAAKAIAEANAQITELGPVKELGSRITGRTREMVGEHQALEAELGIAPLDPLRLLRDLRLFVDAKRRPIATASLGTLNVLYLALLELGLEQRLTGTEIAHVVMAIEEPEAHLHPHLQRVIFRRLLRPEKSKIEQTALVTTHSPHIVSVAPPRNLVVLRKIGDRTEATVAAEADLGEAEWNDIERYLDATRAELVFARRVLLVEGYAEQVLVPIIATSLGLNLDQLGISVCPIHGTHFGSYVRLLTALRIPWAVITDGDPNAEGTRAGVRRAALLLERLESDAASPDDAGIFVGETTFEYDLLAASETNATAFFDALESLGPTAPAAAKIAAWRDVRSPPAAEQLLPLVEGAGKGRLAHRLAETQLDAPEYIAAALGYVAADDERARAGT